MATKNNGMILRNSLQRRFDEISDKRFVYVCAPAGYGKTVSVRIWAERNGRKNAFVSLDEFDNGISRICERFCTALRECQPENHELSKISTHSSFDGEPAEFTFRAIAALRDERACITIDDAHFIRDAKAIRLLAAFINRLPEAFQIVIISRSELPAELSDLALKGTLAQITSSDLRFCAEDITALYRAHGHIISARKASEILQFTGGWAIGIGAVLLSGGSPRGGSLKYLDDFIQANVWRLWDEEIREFMLKTSVVRELTPPLCAALTGNSHSEELLGRMVEQNLFISKTDHGVYKYHQLFWSFLSKIAEERGGEFTRALLERAGRWYLSRKDFYNAVDCFIRCESYKGIIKSFLFLTVIDRSSFIIDKLLPILSNPVVHAAAKKFPLIYSHLAWAAFVEGRANDMVSCADRYYKKQISILRYDPRLAFYIFYTRLIDFRVTVKDLTWMVKKAPINLMSEKLNVPKPSISIINQYMPLLHRGTRDFSECTVGSVEDSVFELLETLGGLFVGEANLLAECMLAGLLYEQGYLEKAYNHALAANSEIKNDMSAETKFCAMSVLVYVLDSLEQWEQAEKTLKRIANMIEHERAYCLSYNFNALMVRRKLSRGNINTACAWLAEHGEGLSENIDFYKLYGHITSCRAFITSGDYDSAIITLKKMSALADSYNRPLDLIETQILLAIAYWKKKRGFQSEALLYLEQAVSTAYIYGFTQMFINEGAELSGMLRRLQKRVEQRGAKAPVPSSFIKKLYLKAAENKKNGLTSGQSSGNINFTEKQLNVMMLLCEGKSYKEIAATLGIKVPTLRSHIALIYKKLDVTSETDAVTKIRAAGIFKDE